MIVRPPGIVSFILLACSALVMHAQDDLPIEKLGPAINTAHYDEASPVLSCDGKKLYFTRSGSPDFERTLINNGTDLYLTLDEQQYKRKLSEIYGQIFSFEIDDPYTSPCNQDIWIAHSDQDEFDFVERPPFPVNNALPNSVVSTALDSHSLVVINQFYSDGSMFGGFSSISLDGEGTYGFPEPMHIYDFYNQSDDVNLALSDNGHVMILSLSREDSYGKNDLYVSFRVMDNLWSTPKNIGLDLNTEHQESTPFISHNGREIYFSSDRPGSLGGSDIWVSERQDYTWQKWSEPRRLTSPVNSIFDDSQAYIDEQGKFLYFSSRRDGSSDIFRKHLQPKPRLKQPIVINGRILNAKTGKPIRAELFHGPQSASGFLEYMHTYTGYFRMELTEWGVYKFFSRKPGFESGTLHFDTRLAEKANRPAHEVIIYLDPIEDASAVIVTPGGRDTEDASPSGPRLAVGDKLSFYNIYFAQSEAVVLSKSFPALDELAATLHQHPTLNIQVEGHTDNVGAERDLMELSWQRAHAIRQYLVARGIEKSRVGVIGFGPQKPITDNTTEANREKNRRVEIRVTQK